MSVYRTTGPLVEDLRWSFSQYAETNNHSGSDQYMIETYSRLLFRYILTLSEINIFISNSTFFLSCFDVDTENAHHTEKVLICVFTVHTRYFIGHA